MGAIENARLWLFSLQLNAENRLGCVGQTTTCAIVRPVHSLSAKPAFTFFNHGLPKLSIAIAVITLALDRTVKTRKQMRQHVVGSPAIIVFLT